MCLFLAHSPLRIFYCQSPYLCTNQWFLIHCQCHQSFELFTWTRPLLIMISMQLPLPPFHMQVYHSFVLYCCEKTCCCPYITGTIPLNVTLIFQMLCMPICCWQHTHESSLMFVVICCCCHYQLDCIKISIIPIEFSKVDITNNIRRGDFGTDNQWIGNHLAVNMFVVSHNSSSWFKILLRAISSRSYYSPDTWQGIWIRSCIALMSSSDTKGFVGSVLFGSILTPPR